MAHVLHEKFVGSNDTAVALLNLMHISLTWVVRHITDVILKTPFRGCTPSASTDVLTICFHEALTMFYVQRCSSLTEVVTQWSCASALLRITDAIFCVTLFSLVSLLGGVLDIHLYPPTLYPIFRVSLENVKSENIATAKSAFATRTQMRTSIDVTTSVFYVMRVET